MTVGMSDGERLWAVRYSSERHSRTLFVSQEAKALRALGHERLERLGDEDRAIVSEPLGDLEGVWLEVPESTAMIVQPGDDEQRPFEPHFDAESTPVPQRGATTW
jgi:predicted glutamine amidotransferase